MNNHSQLLDCTFRDGGYYSNWHFDDDLVRKWAGILRRVGVDYLEVGFRHPEAGSYKGPFAYTSPSKLRQLDLQGPKLAIMIDAKDFKNSSSLGSSLGTLFPDLHENKIELVRVALNQSELSLAEDIVFELSLLNTKVAANLMQVASLDSELVVDSVKRLGDTAADFVYLADSTGSLRPADVARLFTENSGSGTTSLGFHAHDNMGLAVENSLEALRNGASIVDGTALGIGRGAGNAQIERLLTFLGKNLDGALPYLYAVVEKHFRPMKTDYGWGEHLGYFLAGVSATHAGEVQELLANPSHSDSEIFHSLMPPAGHQVQEDIAVLSSLRGNLSSAVSLVEGRELLVVGSGDTARQNFRAINEFARKRNLLICLAGTPSSDAYSEFDLCFISDHAAKTSHSDWAASRGLFIVAASEWSSIDKTLLNECRLGLIEVDHDSEVGLSSTSVLVHFLQKAAASKCWLAGFDGYQPGSSANQEVQVALDNISESLPTVSITDTKYDVETVSVHFLV